MAFKLRHCFRSNTCMQSISRLKPKYDVVNKAYLCQYKISHQFNPFIGIGCIGAIFGIYQTNTEIKADFTPTTTISVTKDVQQLIGPTNRYTEKFRKRTGRFDGKKILDELELVLKEQKQGILHEQKKNEFMEQLRLNFFNRFSLNYVQRGWEFAHLVLTFGVRAFTMEKIIELWIMAEPVDEQFEKQLDNSFKIHGYMSIELAVQVAMKYGYHLDDVKVFGRPSFFRYMKYLALHFVK